MNNEQQILEEQFQAESLRQSSAQALRRELELRELEEQESAIAEIEETDYANRLASDQDLYNIRQQIQALSEESDSFGRPSFFKYSLLLVLAILADALIIGSYLLFGAGLIVSSLIASPFIILILLISWFTDSNIKNAKAHPERLEKTIVAIQQQVATATRVGLRTARGLRKVPGMKGIARAIPRKLVRIRRTASKSPIGRLLIGSGANIIPIINIIPWQVVSILMAYSAEKNTLKEARLASNDAIEQLQLQAIEV